MNKNILITGGAGYIGSHVVELLVKKKLKVFVLDNLIKGSKKLVDKKAIFIDADIRSTNLVNKILINNKIDTVMHLAALTDVQESEKYKKKYYLNNIEGTENLLKACKKTLVKNIIYSSSAGVYGNAKSPVHEKTKIKPINYYSLTKLKGEQIIKKFSKKYKYNYCILRYFNVCGASTNGKIGIFNNKNKSLFKVIAKESLNINPKIDIFGKDFSTKDGTCIRDFIHVSDLAQIHYEMLNYIEKKKKSYTLNCGYGKGYTVLEVVKKFKKIIKRNIKINFKKKRRSEIIISYSNNRKITKLIKWKPKFNNLDIMVKNSLSWEKKLIRTKNLILND